MNDKESIDNKLSAPYLSPKEHLILHQLHLLEWLDAKTSSDEQHPNADMEKPENAKSMPEKWELTKGITLYDWQHSCIEKWFERQRGTIKVVTGAGKTVLALAIAERLQNSCVPELHVAIVVPTIVLMNQWFDEITNKGNLPFEAIGRLGGGYKEDFSKGRRILIAVLTSASKELPGIIERAGIEQKLLFVADECHRLGSKEMSRVFQVKRAFNLGLSATPEREDVAEPAEDTETVNSVLIDDASTYNTSLTGLELGEIIYDFSLADALKLNIVPHFTINHYGLPLSPDESMTYERLSREIQKLRDELSGQVPMGQSIYQFARMRAQRFKGDLGNPWVKLTWKLSQRKDLLYRISSRTEAVLSLVATELEENPDARIIIFHEKIDEVMRLFLILRESGLPVIAEHSDLPNSLRENGLELFRKGIAQIIVSARSLIEGFNVPAIDVGIIAASSSSVRQRIQSLGRVLRKHRRISGEEKTSCIHVLYANKTVDDSIYGKVSWDAITGIDRNRYFFWSPGAEPVPQEGPPRTPPPKDSTIDQATLSFGCIYIGDYEGDEYTCDMKGNISNVKGKYVLNPGDIPNLVKQIKGSYGKFRVTPVRKYVLVRIPEGEDWITRYVTTLAEHFSFPSAADPVVSGEEVELWAKSAYPGKRYPFDQPHTVIKDLKFKLTRGGVISKKISGGEVYARTGNDAVDPLMGDDAQKLIESIRSLNRAGKAVSKLQLNSFNHVLYREGGALYFICALQKGLEFHE